MPSFFLCFYTRLKSIGVRIDLVIIIKYNLKKIGTLFASLLSIFLVKHMTDDEVNKLESLVIDMAIESWRFSRLFVRVAGKLDAGETAKYVNQLRYFQKKVEDGLNQIGLKVVNLEGQSFDAGMAVSAINIEDFEASDNLVVEQMIEPVIMGSDGLRRSGAVMLRKV